MKIGVITDIHILAYENKAKDFEAFIDLLDVDILICAGDWCSFDYKEMEIPFKIIRSRHQFLPILTVLGNHCYWTTDHFISLDELIDQQSELMNKYNIHYLEQNPFIKDNIAVFGYDGWYIQENKKSKDSSMIPIKCSSGNSFQQLKRKEQNGMYHILDNIDNHKDKTRLCVTHFPFWADSEEYKIWNANPRHFDLIIKDNFDYLILGHNHNEQDEVIDGVRVINPGADYFKVPSLNKFFKIIEIK